jgi:hypothetical protein
VAKKEWGDAVKVILDGDSERRFAVQIEPSGNLVNYIAQGSRMRDLIVVSIRTFLWLITKHQGKLNKDLDHDVALSLYVRTLNEQSGAGRMSSVPAGPKRTSVGGGTPTGGKPPVKGQQGTPASKQKASFASGGPPTTPPSHSANPPSNGRRQSGTGEDDWGGFGLPPAQVSHAGSVSGLSASSQSGVQISAPVPQGNNGQPPRPVRRNADGDEVDDEGFIVTKQRGFDEFTTQHSTAQHYYTVTYRIAASTLSLALLCTASRLSSIAPKGAEDSDPEDDSEPKSRPPPSTAPDGSSTDRTAHLVLLLSSLPVQGSRHKGADQRRGPSSSSGRYPQEVSGLFTAFPLIDPTPALPPPQRSPPSRLSSFLSQYDVRPQPGRRKGKEGREVRAQPPPHSSDCGDEEKKPLPLPLLPCLCPHSPCCPLSSLLSPRFVGAKSQSSITLLLPLWTVWSETG